MNELTFGTPIRKTMTTVFQRTSSSSPRQPELAGEETVEHWLVGVSWHPYSLLQVQVNDRGNHSLAY